MKIKEFHVITFLVFQIFVLGFKPMVEAQENNSTITLLDTTQNDTSKTVVYKRKHSPRTASILSACLPGAGQIYNKKYWKLPIVYAGFASGIYFNRYLNSKYVKYRYTYNNFRNPYLSKGKNPPNDSLIEYNGNMYYASEIREARDYVRKYRDLTSICLGAWYILTIIDANVDAYLFEYDVSDNLSINLHPNVYMSEIGKFNTGLTLSFGFNNSNIKSNIRFK